MSDKISLASVFAHHAWLFFLCLLARPSMIFYHLKIGELRCQKNLLGCKLTFCGQNNDRTFYWLLILYSLVYIGNTSFFNVAAKVFTRPYIFFIPKLYKKMALGSLVNFKFGTLSKKLMCLLANLNSGFALRHFFASKISY